MRTPVLREIKSLNNDYMYVENLLKRTFPAAELRPAEKQRRLITENPDFHCMLVCLGKRRIGALNWWRFEDVNFCEHFAIEAGLRGKGIGSKILEFLKYRGKLLLEVELPHSAEAERRIGFYEKQGLIAWMDVPYIQPPYGEGLEPLPMILMASPAINKNDSTQLIKLIRQNVYNV